MKITNDAVMDLLKKRYLLPGETLDQWVDRVSLGDPHIHSYIDNLDFLPNSPTLMNSQTSLGQLAACFVLPIEDNIEGIYDTLKAQAIIHRSGGGTGFNFSKLRPEGSKVGSTNGVASGPCTFMQVFNTSTDVIKQGGKRRGANMGILDISHPDIRKFIHLKADTSKLNNFNISVLITDWAKYADSPLLDEIAKEAWATGEPGVLFQDNINKSVPQKYLEEFGPINATNPCGEVTEYPYEACILGSINLGHFVVNKYFNFGDFRKCVKAAICYLDSIVDKGKWPLPEIESMVRLTRRIGLGVMGFADALLKLGVPYDSDEAIEWAKKIGQALHNESYETSDVRGSGLGNAWGVNRRNLACNTIAPTGTLSLIAGCSSGIEPLFALSFTHHTRDGKDIQVVNPIVKDILAGYPEALKMAEETGSVQACKTLPQKLKDILKTANEIPWKQHIRIQAIWQRYIDNSISKTINMPPDATVEDVKEAYIMAHNLGCKGITVYRDGCREGQVLTAGAEKKVSSSILPPVKPIQIADCLQGYTSRAKTACGKVYLTRNYLDDRLVEAFITMGRSGGCKRSMMEVIGRLISTGLKYGVPRVIVAKQLTGVKCSHPFFLDGRRYESCLDWVGHMMAPIEIVEPSNRPKCPICGEPLLPQDGCWHCAQCGYSKCE